MATGTREKIPAQKQELPGSERKMRPEPRYEPRYAGSDRLKGKAALVSGGDSGIGSAVAILFAREGADVGIIYLSEDEDAEETRKLVEREGARCLLIKTDLAKKENCVDAVNQVIKTFGRLDILVNNAAEQHPEDVLREIDEEQLAETFQTNFFGYFFLTQAALPHLSEGAAIINTTSITAYRGSHHLVDYSATKGAIVSFTRSLAQQLVDKGIRVNGVAPGPIWTPLIPASFDEDKVEDFGAGSPMGRAGQPNEVAPAFLFLACADSSYMTGQVLHPNGGEIVGG